MRHVLVFALTFSILAISGVVRAVPHLAPTAERQAPTHHEIMMQFKKFIVGPRFDHMEKYHMHDQHEAVLEMVEKYGLIDSNVSVDEAKKAREYLYKHDQYILNQAHDFSDVLVALKFDLVRAFRYAKKYPDDDEASFTITFVEAHLPLLRYFAHHDAHFVHDMSLAFSHFIKRLLFLISTKDAKNINSACDVYKGKRDVYIFLARHDPETQKYVKFCQKRVEE